MPSTIPSADDVAIAIIAAARIWRDDPEEVARGVPDLISRFTAFTALEIVFPECPKGVITRMVGGKGTFLSRFERGVSKPDRQRRCSVQHEVAEAVRQGRLRPAGRLTMRREPATLYQDVTADLMGDPAPGSERWTSNQGDRADHQGRRRATPPTLPPVGRE